jgi:zinc transport system substrate-binding protein
MNRPRIIILIFAALLIFICSCSQPQKVTVRKLHIVATIYPYQLIAQQITGDRAEVRTFIPGNASPHTYSPTPRDIQQLYAADLVIANGLNLEANMMSYLKELGTKVIFAGDFIPENLLTQDLEEHMGFNPHIWTDPDMILNIAQGIEVWLEELDPLGKQVYEKNLAQLKLDLAKADKQIESERENYGTLGIITFHDSFKYFNEKYRINLIGTIESSPGKEPSPRELMELETKIKHDNVHAIFIEPEFNPKPAQVLATEYGLSVIKYDPIGTTLNVKTISAFLLKNWEMLKQGFR